MTSINDLCMVRDCIHNNGMGTCFINNGLNFNTYEEIPSEELKNQALEPCNEYALDKENQ
ncbi:hypothetical protein [Paenibacillus tianjinensis]|uniref:DUF1540 domain-containing protein n=1 Tax=Paenibacillus tianjinensis TaxID=2810347 RepID=A0ABX7L7S3_9BACL|nr:hypothetical protein [Paenibacillus tianjinensis]QSF43413.1 hypothetical protein JRJ22_19305 [Paenibacillus tianjinensis]